MSDYHDVELFFFDENEHFNLMKEYVANAKLQLTFPNYSCSSKQVNKENYFHQFQNSRLYENLSYKLSKIEYTHNKSSLINRKFLISAPVLFEISQ